MVKNDANLPLINGKHALALQKNLAGVKIMTEFADERPSNKCKIHNFLIYLEEETDRLKLSHHMDYRFFKHEAKTFDKDFLKNANYVI